MGLRGRVPVLLVAASGLLSLATALYQESFVHTDDGCAVEIHCLACRLAVASAPDTPIPAPVPSPPNAPASPAVRHEPGTPLDRAVRQSQPRAPPLA